MRNPVAWAAIPVLVSGAMSCGSGGTDGGICTLGTIYPGVPVIDPDAPVYSDADWTQEEVEAAFAAAKAEDNIYYRGYLAADKYPDLLECAFCSCGCAKASIHHRSDVDCFKDMHGFT